MTAFEIYFKSLQFQKISDITEHSHRPALKDLVESLAGENVKILHEPKREGKFGSPDFKVTHTESIIGYIENKKIEENLDKTIKTDQIKKYQSLSDNLLLTNYIDWIWIKEGKVQKCETLCLVTDIENKRGNLDKSNADAVENLIKSFLSQAPKEIADAKKLAEALAIRAKLLKDFLFDELKRQEQENTEGRLFQLHETFKTFIFHELTISEFSDAFAQNLVYGLFLAKLNADVKLVSLNNAWDYIPTTFELIKELVDFLKELKRDEYRETKWIVEEVLTIMNNLDLRAIQESLSFTKKRKDADNNLIKDPYVYFYENFLAAYDKKLREAKGVYYTPTPVVNFIVRAIDDILINTLKIKDGLADRNRVTVLDFATGTGTFLVEVLQQMFEKLPKGSGKKDLLIKEHVLKNIFGFEYLIAPYTIAHLKLSQFLKDNGYTLKDKERLQIYLTNTLEPIPSQIKIPMLPALTEESKQAQHVKDKPILVITGNPPYETHSKNTGHWIKSKIDDYKFVDGKKLDERNSKVLQDDYVKFIRFAQDKMNSVEEGVVGIITNHSFLDNPTFRGMRKSLMDTFNQIYFIDLHGNSDKKEKVPSGQKNENVFDIKAGVSISIFVKKKNLEKQIFHCDVWGSRKEKYEWCLKETLSKIETKKIAPESPFYLFIPQNKKAKKVYEKYISVKDIFATETSGVKTHNDDVLIAFDEKELINKISKHYKQKANPSLIKSILYRPFDTRKIYYDRKLVIRARDKFYRSVETENLYLVIPRQTTTVGYEHAMVSNDMVEMKAISNDRGSYVFPLVVSEKESLFNIHDKFVKSIQDLYKDKKIDVQEIFNFIYSILHSPSYRNKYSEFLKVDFPRIPFPENKKIFEQLSELGNELIQKHLLKEEIENNLGEYLGKGNHIVEKPNYIFEKKVGKLYINKTQYFNNVPQEVYHFNIGGYPVLEKYLKERKGRDILLETDHIEDTIKALAFTIFQMKQIDSLTKNWI